MDSSSWYPFWGLLLLEIFFAILLGLGSIWLANRTLHQQLGKGHNDTLAPIVTTVGIVYGVLLGFTVIAAWQQYAAADDNVANEASTLTAMYRQTVAMPSPEQGELRGLLRRYTEAVIGPEWQAQYTGGTSDTAREAITAMYRNLGAQPPSIASGSINGQFLSELTMLTTERNTRTLDAQSRMPWVFWIGLDVGAVIVLIITGFIYMESTRFHVVVSSMVAVLIALLLFIVFVMEHPFGTPAGVGTTQFQHSLMVFDAVDRGI